MEISLNVLPDTCIILGLIFPGTLYLSLSAQSVCVWVGVGRCRGRSGCGCVCVWVGVGGCVGVF